MQLKPIYLPHLLLFSSFSEYQNWTFLFFQYSFIKAPKPRVNPCTPIIFSPTIPLVKRNKIKSYYFSNSSNLKYQDYKWICFTILLHPEKFRSIPIFKYTSLFLFLLQFFYSSMSSYQHWTLQSDVEVILSEHNK